MGEKRAAATRGAQALWVWEQVVGRWRGSEIRGLRARTPAPVRTGAVLRKATPVGQRAALRSWRSALRPRTQTTPRYDLEPRRHEPGPSSTEVAAVLPLLVLARLLERLLISRRCA